LDQKGVKIVDLGDFLTKEVIFFRALLKEKMVAQ